MLNQRYTLDMPACYKIRVQGNVSANWIDYFEGISVVLSAPRGAVPVSTIYVPDSDQAAVLGILNTLYDRGFPLLYLERLDDAESKPALEQKRNEGNGGMNGRR